MPYLVSYIVLTSSMVGLKKTDNPYSVYIFIEKL